MTSIVRATDAYMVWLQQALVGESSGEEQLFSSENNTTKDSISTELDRYLQRLKVRLFYCPQISD